MSGACEESTGLYSWLRGEDDIFNSLGMKRPTVLIHRDGERARYLFRRQKVLRR